MSRILFDVNVPRPASKLLTRHSVEFSDQRGWRELENGDLLRVAELDGFDVMVTADKGIGYQQNLTGRRIAIVALSTNAWPVIRAHPAPLIDAVDTATPGSYREVTLPHPPSNR